MLKKFISTVAMCMFMCLVLSSCNFSGKSKEAVAEMDTEKYNSYITLSNYISGWLDPAFESYFKEFGSEKEMRIKKNFSGFDTYPILDVHKEDVKEAFEYASKEPSYGATDDAMKALYPSLKEIMKTVGSMEDYYSAKSFSDDNFAKGKEFHKKICEEYKKYFDLSQKFYAEFSSITEKKKKEDLEKLKSEDCMIRYYAMSILTKAQNIETSFYKAGINDSNILKFDANEYKKKYDSITEDINKFMEYSKDEERVKKEGLESNAFLGRYTSDVERFKATATDIMQILKTKNVNVNSDSKGKVATSGGNHSPLYRLSERISDLVNSYNNILK